MNHARKFFISFLRSVDCYFVFSTSDWEEILFHTLFKKLSDFFYLVEPSFYTLLPAFFLLLNCPFSIEVILFSITYMLLLKLILCLFPAPACLSLGRSLFCTLSFSFLATFEPIYYSYLRTRV